MEYYGDTTRWFIGRVIDAENDPLGLGRVKIRIFGIHPEDTSLADKDDLPWASVVVPITEGGVAGIGTNLGLKNQAQVYGIFLDGKTSQIPLVIGSIPKFEEPLQEGTPYHKDRDDTETIPGGVEHKEVEPKTKETDGDIGVNYDHTLPGTSNVEKAFLWLISKEGLSLTPAQAAGVIGNFLVESGKGKGELRDISPTIKNPTKEASEGIAQWNPDIRYRRLQELKIYAARVLKPSVDYRTMYAQLNYIKYEMTNKKIIAFLGDLGLSALKETYSPEDAAKVFMIKFEKPSADPAVNHIAMRMKYAREVYVKYGGYA